MHPASTAHSEGTKEVRKLSAFVAAADDDVCPVIRLLLMAWRTANVDRFYVPIWCNREPPDAGGMAEI